MLPLISGLQGIENHPEWQSPNSWWMILLCLCSGSFLLLFELKTFAWPNVMIMPWLWHVRVVGYIGSAVMPVMYAHELMPPLLPAIGFLIAGGLNLLAVTSGALPSTIKDWSWPLLGSNSKEQTKIADAGGLYENLCEPASLCPMTPCSPLAPLARRPAAASPVALNGARRPEHPRLRNAQGTFCSRCPATSTCTA
jgi:hypothetical protein